MASGMGMGSASYPSQFGGVAMLAAAGSAEGQKRHGEVLAMLDRLAREVDELRGCVDTLTARLALVSRGSNPMPAQTGVENPPPSTHVGTKVMEACEVLSEMSGRVRAATDLLEV